MDTGTPHHVKEHHVHQRHFDRLVMLSDGVFAIALTLSAVELHPQAEPGQGLLQIWAKPLGVYFLSFFLIGLVWLRQRRTLAHLYKVDGPITVSTLILLSIIALVPVFIRVLLEDQGAALGNGMLIYSLLLMVIHLCLALEWGYAAFIGKLAPSVSPPRAVGWLLEEVLVAVFFAAVALYSLSFRILALVMVVAGVAIRIIVKRMENKARALDAEATGDAGSHGM